MPNINRFLAQDKEYIDKVLPVEVKKIVIEASSSYSWNSIVFNPKYLITLDEYGKSGTKEDIYKEYGFSKEYTINVVRPGKTGADEIKQMMTNFRENPPKTLGGSKVILSKDYKTLEAKDNQGNVTKLDMPDTSNVLQWFCEDGTKVSVRPSGTEPKIKFYTEVKDTNFSDASDYDRCSKKAEEKIEAIKKDLNL